MSEKDAPTPLLAKQLSREYNFTSQGDRAQAMRMGSELYIGGVSQGRDELRPEIEMCRAIIDELVSALKAVRLCLRADTGEVGEYWTAREWLRTHNRYEDNLQNLAVPLEVCDVVLLISEAGGAAIQKARGTK